jgi:hypothetical protein
MKTIRIILFIAIASAAARAKVPVPESNEPKPPEQGKFCKTADKCRKANIENAVLVVNGHKLSQNDFSRYFDYYFRQGMERYKRENPDADIEQAKILIKEKALNTIILRMLYDEELDRENIKITDEDMKI